MEKEDLKTIWDKYNGKLEEITAINENLLKHTLRHRSNGVIDNILKWEYLSMIEITIFLFFMLITTYKFMDDWRFLTSGIFIILFLTSCIISGFLSIKKLNSIQMFSQSIVDIKQRILMHKKLVNRFMKIFMFLIPPVIITFIPLGTKFVRNISLYDYPLFFLILSLVVIVFSYIIAFISNQTIYVRKFNIIDNSLKELEKYKEE
jgi:hypothetical protein